MEENEIIKPIPNYNNYYVSNHGNCYCSLCRGFRSDIVGRDFISENELHKIKPRPTKNGYQRIYARNSVTGKRKDLYVHRLVAEAFVENPDPENKKYVNHKDFNRANNNADNLEWVTAKENNDYTLENKHVIRNRLGQFESNIDVFEMMKSA